MRHLLLDPTHKKQGLCIVVYFLFYFILVIKKSLVTLKCKSKS